MLPSADRYMRELHEESEKIFREGQANIANVTANLAKGNVMIIFPNATACRQRIR